MDVRLNPSFEIGAIAFIVAAWTSAASTPQNRQSEQYKLKPKDPWRGQSPALIAERDRSVTFRLS